MPHDMKDVPMPRFGKTALDLLDSRDDEPKSLTNKYGIRFIGGMLGAGAHGATNWAYRRPRWAGSHKYVIGFAAGATLAYLVEQYRINYFAERDAVLRHYIQLHPDDFQPPERKKYADVMMEWVPIR